MLPESYRPGMTMVWSFVPVALVFGITPGPDVALALRSSLAHGIAHGVAVALGAAAGSLAWGIAAAAGVATFIIRVPAAFEILRWAGAIYLGLLGMQAIVTAGAWLAPGDSGTSPASAPVPKAFWTGLIADLLNPKMGIFYLAVIPQFIPEDGPVFAWAMVLMAIEFVIAIICLSTYALLASSARRLLTRGAVATWMERVLGAVLLGLGVRVAIG